MKRRLIISLCFLLSVSFYGQEREDAENICKQFIKNKKSTTENKSDNGLKNGYWSFYYNDKDSLLKSLENVHSILIVNYSKDIVKGICVYCLINGKLDGYAKLIEDTTFLENGTFYWLTGKGIIEENIRHDKREGETREYYSNGKLKFLSLYENDTLRSITHYRKDKSIIACKTYMQYNPEVVSTLYTRKDATPIILEHQVDGKDDGDYFIYYKNGKVKLAAKNENGYRVNEKIYDKEGILLEESICEPNGINCVRKIFDKKGNVKKEYPFKWKGFRYKIEF